MSGCLLVSTTHHSQPVPLDYASCLGQTGVPLPQRCPSLRSGSSFKVRTSIVPQVRSGQVKSGLLQDFYPVTTPGRGRLKSRTLGP